MPETTSPPPRVREIFLGALEEETSINRKAYLDRACAGDATLRSAVESMLEETQELGEFLEQPPATELQIWRNGKSSEHIGPYKLLQEIGEGGCGVVYMAEQEHPVRRRVALKIIKLGMDTKSVIARFESERQALAMMDHPNIAKVLDAGATENGRPYFVMELVRGVRITDYCNQHRLSTEERLRLFVQVSQAIQHAHQKGIIHRDIKPSNILVTLHDGKPVPKIIDFGIAKAVDQRLTDKTLFTEFQSFIGTPAYMSPEQAEMTGLDIDTRSDIYALGVLLYELLVGSTPFDPATLRDAGLDECRRTIREVEPARPSQRLSTLLDADRKTIANQRVTEGPVLVSRLKGDLDWIVMKCLEKDRQRRYATANALAMDVQRYIDGDLVSARPPSTVYRLQKAWRRHRLVGTAAAAVLVALVLGIGVSTWQAFRATYAEQESTRLRLEAEHNLEQAVQSTARARLNEYVADMNVANHSLQDGNFGRAWQLLEKHQPADGSADLRGFEWRYLAGLSKGDDRLAYPNQGAAIKSLTLSPDGILLAVSMDKAIKIWDTRTQSLIITLPFGSHTLAFVANGRGLVSADSESIRIWNTTTWTEQLAIPTVVSHMAVSADGRWLATSSRRGRTSSENVRILDTTNWEEFATIANTSGVLAFSPEGDQLAIGTRNGIGLWNTRRAELIQTLEDSSELFTPSRFRPSWIAYSPDGKTIVAPANDLQNIGAFHLCAWNAPSGRHLGFLPEDARHIHHKSTIATADWTPDSKVLITGSWDHSIQLWDMTTHENVGTLKGHHNEVWAMAVDPTGETVASGGKDGELLLWPVRISRKKDVINGNWRPLAFDREGSQLAAINRENHLTFFQTESLSSLRTLDLGTFTEHWFQPPVAISDDLKILATVESEDSLEIRNLATEESRFIPIKTKGIFNLTLSPDGSHLIVSRHRDPEVTWWDLQQPDKPRQTIEAEQALFSTDGSTLVTVPRRGEGEAAVWDVISGQRRLALLLSADLGLGSTATLSAQGTILAIATGPNDANHAIRLWDLETGALLGSCLGHKQGIRAVAFSPDGKTLASASDDSSLKLWNVTTQQELLSIQRVGSSVASLVFSPDGEWLAAGSRGSYPSVETGELRLFHAPRLQ